ncbi:hypothetical protein P148_SR1C00001G1035 [candidate division SR1 bacterium RAAC1_SR1_1]|nr:hypothetical protein P148_SR1C00001G1035 [candidate division SR1 bacterium RAAC1_SR1_1]
MIEFEKTFLLKTIPFDLQKYPHKELVDHYIPIESEHPKLRLRKRGNLYEITKKTLVQEGDSSVQREQTIELSKVEYEALAELPNKLIHKIRYYVPYEEFILEIDLFQENLDGLILMDVEFPDRQTMECFTMPDFCLADITQNELFAGGMLCGKTYASLSGLIKQYMGEI